MTIYRITYTSSIEVNVEASRLEDDGISTKLFRDDGSVALWVTDCEIVCCVPAGDFAPDVFDVGETQQGVVLLNEAGEALAAYRNYIAS
ncbi:hypothetical protein [Mesorhizobium sp. B2-4-11]|uniref:hypothetical protein n=1 Tax=Mesorhizobium sp. B2-4-11 TaxID=2589938 RepID=UPI00112DE52D|nr:hypothetical protein [Mesorhizobium sp. B2-4-11]TPL06697.1 hypothetical protein FJ944_22990 [Mesorhizobium sp. B2-4-11]